jgi:carbamoyltransferase
MNGSLLGPIFGRDEIQRTLAKADAPYICIEKEKNLLARTAAEIANGKVVGWFQGRMEFGPRALGSRSIIGDPRNPKMQSAMNLRIKFRESFRPFAPCVLEEDMGDYFQLDRPSPYMLLVAEVRDEIRRDRSSLPAITHVDMSARVQTADRVRNGMFWKLLREFKAQTGCGVLINTSFNIRGEPIVCTPEDAYRCFMATDMDILVIGDCFLQKSDQPEQSRKRQQEYIDSFQLD